MGNENEIKKIISPNYITTFEGKKLTQIEKLKKEITIFKKNQSIRTKFILDNNLIDLKIITEKENSDFNKKTIQKTFNNNEIKKNFFYEYSPILNEFNYENKDKRITEAQEQMKCNDIKLIEQNINNLIDSLDNNIKDALFP